MANYIYECPACNSLVKLHIDLHPCPFMEKYVGKCGECGEYISVFQKDYEKWAKGKEAKSDES